MTQQARINKSMYWDEALSLVSGCTPVSPGCDNCWSAKETHMRASHTNEKVKTRNAGLTEHGCFNGQIRLNYEFLDKPLRKKKPTVYAIWNDLFHPSVPFEFVDQAFAVMALCPQHTFLILTKRPERMLEYMSVSGRYNAIITKLNQGDVWDLPLRTVGLLWKNAPREDRWPLPNVWLGVTAENQEQADKRIPILLQIPAAVRFVSVEPMLGEIDLTRIHYEEPYSGTNYIDCLAGTHEFTSAPYGDRKIIPCERIDWAICGGETGPGARPMHPDWVRRLRDQCQAAGVPYFFKQWGEWIPMFDQPWDKPPIGMGEGRFRIINLNGGHGYHGEGAIWTKRVGKKRAGRLLDGRTWDEMPVIGR